MVRSLLKGILFSSLLIGLNAFASPASLTYQGRIVKADGSPLEYGSVSFQFEILNSSGLCVLYREQVNGINMVHSNGIFDVKIGASHSYPLSASFSIVDSFNNSVNQTCDGGSVFSPSATEGRILRVQFHDGTAWRLISPDTQIRSVPYAGYAMTAAKLGDKTAADFVGRPTSCSAGQVVTFDGTNFNCAASAGGGSGTVTSVAAGAGLAGGTITATGTLSLAPIADKSLLANISGSAAAPTATTISALIDSAISNTQGGVLYRNNTGWVSLPPGTNGHYLQTQGAGANPQWAAVAAGSSGTVTSVAAGTGLTGGTITSTGTLAVNVGTGASQIPQLDGSGKLVAAVIPTNIVTSSTTLSGDLSGNLPNPTVVGLRGRAIDATAPTDGQVLIWDNGNTTWKAQHVRMEDVRNSWGGTTMLPGTACTASQAMIWSALTDRFTCQNIGSLDAAAVSTGVFNTGRLGTGTADNTKYLRGDGTWQTPSASDASKLPLAGGQMAGDIDMNGHKITNVSNIPWTATNPGGGQDMQSLRWDATNGVWQWFTAGAAGSGITSVNGATGAAHTLAPTASGTTYGFTTSSNTHTFSIPSASGAGVTAGTISKTEYDSFAGKQAAGNYATALSGDVTSTGYSAGTLTTSIANNAVVTAKINDGAVTGAKLEDVSGLVAGTYPKVTVDAKGRVTTGASLAATDIPNLDAAKITTGVFPVARLATGTPDGTKFLRDDGTWQAVSVTETDPQVGANTTNYVSKWDGSALVASGIFENAGNVGIGTGSPTAPLDIGGTIKLGLNPAGGTDQFVVSNTTGDAYLFGYSTGSTSATIGAYNWNTSSGVNLIFNPTGGNVGIGTTSPTAALDVNGVVRIRGGTPGVGKVLTSSDANGNATWEAIPASSGGTVTSVAAGTGLTGGTITSTGTLAVNVGTGANQIPQLDGSGKLEAAVIPTNILTTSTTLGGDLSGNLPNPTVVKIQGRSVANTAPSTGQVLVWDQGTTTWTVNNIRAQDISTIWGGTQIIPSSSCGAAQAMVWSTITDRMTCQNIGSLDAAAVSTGTFAVGRLGTGTADNTKYLRGDGTWQTLSTSDASKLPLAGGQMAGDIDMNTHKITNVSNVPWTAANPGGGQNMQSLRWNNGNSQWEWFTAGAAGAGIASINSDSTSAQVLAPTASGTSYGFTTSSGTHTFSIPSAGTAGVTAGTISKTEYDSFAGKQAAGNYATALSGDVTSTGYSAGTLTTAIANNAVTTAKINDGAVTTAKINDGAVTGAKLEDVSGLVAGTYPKVTVDAKGRVTTGASLAATDIPNLDAAKITTGVFPVARLATGTPDGTKFLRDDGTWQAVSVTETDPQVGANTTNYVSKWDGSALVASGIFENSGAVGVGTGSPTTTLHIAKSAGTLPATNANDIAVFQHNASSSQDAGIRIFSGETGVGYMNFGNRTASDAAGIAFLHSTQTMFFNIGGTSPIVVLPSGNIGMGTASPDTRLHVAGQVKITGGTPGLGKVLTSDANGLATWTTPAAGNAGTVTSVTAGTGIVTSPGGGITSTGSVAVDVGTNAGQIPQLNGSGKLEAAVIPTNIVTTSTTLGGDLSGNLPNPTVAKIQGRSVANTAPSTGQVLIWDQGTTTWTVNNIRAQDISTIWGGTQIIPSSSCGAAQAMVWSTITDRMTCQNIGSLDAAAVSSGVFNTARLGTGTADNTKYLRGDGTWATTTSGLTHVTESLTTTAPNATIPAVRLIASNAAASVDFVLSAKGSGALLAQVPDGTATGGNKRGLYAVDWQRTRWDELGVASGDYSVAAGGDGNRASGIRSAIGGGQYNTASADGAVVGGGTGNLSSGVSSTVGGGAANQATGVRSTSIGGTGNIASGNTSTVIGGDGNLAIGNFSVSANYRTTANAYAQTAFGAYNLPTGSENATTWVAADPLFVVGNGTGSGASRSNALMILKNGNVGIGVTSPTVKLEVAGSVAVSGSVRTTGQISTPSQDLTAGSIDWNSGNTAKTSYDCSGNLSFANLRDGGTYTLVVTSTGTTQCSFSTTTTGTDAGTVTYRFKPANAARTASSYTVYTLLRVGNEVLVSWTSGF